MADSGTAVHCTAREQRQMVMLRGFPSPLLLVCVLLTFAALPVDAQGGTRPNPLPRKIRFDMLNLGVVNQPGKGVPLFRGLATCHTVIDVGAFTGMDHVLHGIRMGHRVIAFEPNTENVKGIVGTVSHFEARDRVTVVPVEAGKPPSVPSSGCWSGAPFGHAFVVPAAVSNQTGTLTFHAREDIGSAAPQAFWRDTSQGWNVTDVPAFRIDDVVDEDVWYLKLDVQGGELAALQGASALLRKYRVPYLMTEFWPAGIAQAGGDAMAMLELLHAHGCVCCGSPPGSCWWFRAEQLRCVLVRGAPVRRMRGVCRARVRRLATHRRPSYSRSRPLGGRHRVAATSATTSTVCSATTLGTDSSSPPPCPQRSFSGGHSSQVSGPTT